MTEIIENQIYKHHSEMRYKVKKIILDATNYEKGIKPEKVILYIQLDKGKYPVKTLWIRKEEDFKNNFKLEQN